MNSNTLFRIFGYFVLSLCVFTVRATDTAAPSVVPIGKPNREIGGPTGVRGAVKPIITIPEVPILADDVLPRAGSGHVNLPVNSVGGAGIIAEFDDLKSVVADDPTIVTAELAKDAAVAQAKEADTQEKNAEAAKKVAGEKAVLAKEGIVDVQSAVTKAGAVSEEAKLAENAAAALLKAEEVKKEVVTVVEKAKIVEDAAQDAQAQALEAEKAANEATAAADIAKVRAEKAETLDQVPTKPTAKVAKEQAAAAEKSALAAKASSVTAAESAVAANEAKTQVEKLVKEAEVHEKDAFAAVKAKEDVEKPVVPVAPIAPVAPVKPAEPSAPAKEDPNKEELPDKPKKAEMNYVKDNAYNYQAQLLKEDRCSEKEAKDAKCKKNSNCYKDHTKPVCICFPGFTSDDATKKACTKVDSPTCKNEANTCHINANCKEHKTLGIGCQCKDSFSGDGLLCSSAFSYFMNFFLVLAIVSVQLYM